MNAKLIIGGEERWLSNFHYEHSMKIVLMHYVDMPFETGVYENFYTLKGLESNRVLVEFVFEQQCNCPKCLFGRMIV